MFYHIKCSIYEVKVGYALAVEEKRFKKCTKTSLQYISWIQRDNQTMQERIKGRIE